MKFTYNLLEEAYVQFNMHHIENSKTVQTSLNVQRFGIPLIYIVVAIVLSFVTEMRFIFLFLVELFFFCGIGFYLLPLRAYMLS